MPARRTTSQTNRWSELPFTCECGTAFSAPIYHAVNVTLDPHLLYELLAGRLNLAICPNCGRRLTSSLPFVYHDMKRGLFAYVHPGTEPDEEERDQLLEELRRVYSHAVEQAELIQPTPPPSRPRSAPGVRADAAANLPVVEPDAPPMQIIFGLDRLVALVDSLLEPEERLGHVDLTSRSTDATERARLLALAQRIAAQTGCQVAADDVSGVYTVRLYGPRSRVGQLVRLLHTVS